jgi:predicted DNA binding CopG/RHH family protein/uncharacterized DUF497 family protein
VEFNWDAENRKHIARHGIAPEEAEEAVLIDPLEAGAQHENEERVLCFGRTKLGRLLTILYTGRRGKTRIVTAYEMTKDQQRIYFEGEMSMPKKQIAIPKFRTEAEEAEWWDSHPEVATEIMKRAIKSGKARRAVPLKSVTMRLPVPDIQRAQDLARQKGLPYQTYIKMLLHEALEKERRTA